MNIDTSKLGNFKISTDVMDASQISNYVESSISGIVLSANSEDSDFERSNLSVIYKNYNDYDPTTAKDRCLYILTGKNAESSVNVRNRILSNVSNPVQAKDAANKQYVENLFETLFNALGNIGQIELANALRDEFNKIKDM